ncbi:hypothetical protein AGMMS50293_06530 [Spirochaetia bacterium]|nr:hypothetical protein AGMMS50293_06530 [Spirochaetia bacterium]
MENYFRITNDSIHIDIKAVPGASKTEFAGIKDNRLRIRIAAAPEDGKANVELIAFLAKTLDCPKRDIRLLSGEKYRLKSIAIPLGYKVKLENITGGKK